MKFSSAICPLIVRQSFVMVAAWLAVQHADAQPRHDTATQSTAIHAAQIGAAAGKQYQGEGLSIAVTSDGARLRCDFQHLEGEVTSEGLWLKSTNADEKGERFRVMAMAVGRGAGSNSPPAIIGMFVPEGWDVESHSARLASSGSVSVEGSLARFIREGLTEEYSVSVDGVRQDFVVPQRPGREGDLRVELALTGARAESRGQGARLVLEGSGRKLAYSRLHVVDGLGRELPARLHVRDASHLDVLIEDATAVYPVRIDPTFSDEDWGSMGGLLGADEFVSAAVADGAGNLYIGGYFTVVGDIRANHVARWDGSEWSALGSGLDDTVWALAVSGTNLYVGGDFSWADESETNVGIPVNRIARWDGSRWSALGMGVGVEPGPDVWDYVAALAVVGTNVYAAGEFSTAGGIEVGNIARWNGTAWSALGSGMDGDVFALAAMGGDLYAGGYFSTAGGTPAENIARWNGSAWSALGSGVDDSVQALAVMGTSLFAGGDFTSAGGNDANYIARWNGSAWSPVGSGFDDRVSAFVVSGTDLYAGGWFSMLGDERDAYFVAKWNGSNWSTLGEGADDYVNALAMVGNTLYVGGDFELVGGRVEIVDGDLELVGQKQASFIARWNGSDWSALGSGLSGFVYALAVSGTTLYAGGDFTTADVNPANCVAKWDGSTWSALGSGMNSPVKALAASGAELYAGGEFTTAGGTAATHIARWNGNSWSPLGSGMNDFGHVFTLVTSGTDLYAGGDFIVAGGTEANRVARWNGSTWSAVGSGTDASVYALAVSGADLYAGGAFVTAGGSPIQYLARWDGTSWSALGSGINSQVHALALVGTNLYVGGIFTTAGETPAKGIARWNGSAWSALGLGVEGSVMTLAVSGTDLYAGGFFTKAGGSPANSIARWNGSAWFPLGSGTDASIFALAVVGSDLFAGGDFIAIGNRVSAFAAKAYIGGAQGGRFNNFVHSPANGFSFNFLDATPGQTYRIQSSPSPVTGSWSDLTNFTYAGSIVIVDASVAGVMNRFYRAITP